MESGRESLLVPAIALASLALNGEACLGELFASSLSVLSLWQTALDDFQRERVVPFFSCI